MDRNIVCMDNAETEEVVPYVGTWIEIELIAQGFSVWIVVPYVGTWIEIYSQGSR